MSARRCASGRPRVHVRGDGAQEPAGGGGLGLREENVLIFNLEAARLERWRGGDVVDSRPLALRGVRDGDGDAAGALRLLLGEEGGKETSLALSARWPPTPPRSRASSRAS